MNEVISAAALKALNIDADVSGDLSEDEIKEITDKISSYKVYTDDSLKEYATNVRNDFRGTIENESFGKAMEKIEKDFKQKHGVELKKGEDYQNALELFGKVLESKVSESSTDDELKNTITQLQDKLKELNEDKDRTIGELTSKHSKTITDMVLDSEISKFESLLDVSDELKTGQLDFIKYNFDKRYELRDQDGKTVVFDKQSEEVVKNEMMAPESLTNVLNKMAPSLVKFKTNEPRQGRANEPINEPVTSVVLKKFKTPNDFNKYLTDNQISPTSDKGIELYATWKKSQGEPVNL